MSMPQEPDSTAALLSTVPDLLLLLADLREQLERARLDLVESERRAQRAVAEAGDLRTEAERAAGDLVVAQARAEALGDQLDTERRDTAEQVGRLEAERQHRDAAIAAYEAQVANLGNRLEEMLASRSWRLTAPVRALGGRRAGRRAAGPSQIRQ